MKCRYCKREIPDESLFCMVCGEKVVREKRKKKEEKQIKVPMARQLKSGSWYIWLEKEKTGVTEATEQLCTEKARAIRSGVIEQQKKTDKKTLRKACQEYIDKREGVCSESTLYNYQQIVNGRFQAYMDRDINSIDWQKMVSDEVNTRKPTKKEIKEGLTPKKLSGKTIMNAWGFVASVIDENDIHYHTPTLPQRIKRKTFWLDCDDQLKTFLKCIRGQQCEFGALLGLHSLRRSEIYDITPNDIVYNRKLKRYEIHVEGAIVRGRNGKTEQDTNKSETSRRIVPVLIPRLVELAHERTDLSPDDHFVEGSLSTLYARINKVCRENGLPEVGVHGLRRTFATLCFYRGIKEQECADLGGWDDYETMHECYVFLSKQAKADAVDNLSSFFADIYEA